MFDQVLDSSAKARLILAAVLRVSAKKQSAADLAKRRALRPVHGVADALFGPMKKAFLKSFSSDGIKDEETALEAVDRNYDALNDALIALLLRGVIASGQVHARVGIKTLSAPDLRDLLPRDQHLFDSSNPAAIEWAREHAGKLITGMKEDAKAAVRTIIADGIEKGRSVGDTADLLKDAVGLTDRQAGALLDFEEQLEAEGLSKAEIRDEIAARAEEMTDARAEVIARTETMAAANEGQQELWDQAVEKGLLNGDEMKEWIYTPDGNACPDCEELDGQTVPIDEEFPDGDPPLHPNCRCTFGISASEERTLRAAEHDFSSTQVYPPRRISNKVLEYELTIPNESLAEKNGGREVYPHVTVRYGLHTDSWADIKEVVDGFGPVQFTIGTLNFFEHEDYDVVYAEIQSDDLKRLNALLTDQLVVTETQDAYRPHMTIAYVQPGLGKSFVGVSVEGVTGEVVTVSDLAFSTHDDDISVLPLANDEYVVLRGLQYEEPIRNLGGPGSGNFGHAGRPGDIGGSEASSASLGFGRVRPDLEAQLQWTGSQKGLDAAIAKYTGADYKTINASLREGNPNKDAQTIIKGLEEVPPLEKPVIVWRGLKGSPGGMGEKLVKMAPGAVIQMNGLQSTSISALTALSFGKTLLKIEAKKGIFIKGKSKIEKESEFLMNHGHKFVVRSVQKQIDGTHIISMRQQ